MYRKLGFTIIELLIVIVVIAILVGISVIAFVNVPKQARDSQRSEGVAAIAKALELYYMDNGSYPNGKCVTGCRINTGWSTTNDDSWKYLEEKLVPKYVSSLPTDPKPSIGSSPLGASAQGYAYFSNSSGVYCGAEPNQMYILVYSFESSTNVNNLDGACTKNALGPYSGKSNYRVAEGGQ